MTTTNDDGLMLITTALFPEAKPCIEILNLTHFETNGKWNLYRNNEFALIVTGTGPIRAATTLSSVLSRLSFSNEIPKLIVNLGLTGARSAASGSCFLINQIRHHASGRTYIPDILVKHRFAEAGLLCVDKPLYDKSVIPPHLDLADMESAGLFEAASHFLSPHQILLFKIVSDNLEQKSITSYHIENLLKPHLEDIFDHSRKVVSYFNIKHDPIKNYHHLITELSQYFSLTLTQQRQLKNWSRHYILRKGSLSFDDYIAQDPPKTPEQRKLLLHQLKNQLLLRHV